MIINTTNSEVIEDLKPYRVSQNDIYTLDSKIPGYKAICYEADESPICIVSDSYGILQHDDVVKRTLSDLDKLGVKYNVNKITMNATKKRNTMATTVLLPDLKMDVDGSDIFGTIYIHNGTDGMTSFTRELGFYRSICQNGMRVPHEIIVSEKMRHRKNIQMMNLEDELYSLADYLPKFGKILEAAQQITLDELNLDNMVKMLNIAPRLFESIMSGEYMNKYKEMVNEQVNLKTLWGFYQVMTNYLTHRVASKSIRTEHSMSNKLYNYMLQQTARRA